MNVKLHWAERFLNWFPHNTKLYLRGERGKNWEQVNKLHSELFNNLVPFLDQLKQEAYNEGFEQGMDKAAMLWNPDSPRAIAAFEKQKKQNG